MVEILNIYKQHFSVQHYGKQKSSNKCIKVAGKILLEYRITACIGGQIYGILVPLNIYIESSDLMLWPFGDNIKFIFMDK